MDRLVAAGKVGGLFGVRGELSLVLYDVFPREPNMEEPVFVKIDSHTVPLFFQSFRRRGQRGATVVFEDIDTENRAAELVGLEFSVAPDSNKGKTLSISGSAGATDDDELYLEDLVGWEVEVGTGRRGRITDFFDSEFNPLFEITFEGGLRAGGRSVDDLNVGGQSADSRLNAAGGVRGTEGESVLIPAQDDFIVEVDERRRKVVFELPEGLLDLNI